MIGRTLDSLASESAPRFHGWRSSAAALALAAAAISCLLSGCTDSAGDTLSIKTVRSWMLPADGAKITAPRAVNVGPDDEIYVLDDNGRVLVFGDDGELLRQWRMPESSIGRPEGVCFLKDGRIVVADTHYDRLVFFDATGRVLSFTGTHGNKPGQFVYPVAVCQDDRGFIYAAEYGDKKRVQKFTPQGEFVLEFGESGTEPGQFQRPAGMIWRDGRILVADAVNNTIQAFHDDGRFDRVVHGADTASELQYPYDLTCAPDGSLFVAEHKAGCVSRLDASGRVTGRFGSTGRGKDHLWTPWSLVFRGESRIVIADTGNRRIVEIEL